MSPLIRAFVARVASGVPRFLPQPVASFRISPFVDWLRVPPPGFLKTRELRHYLGQGSLLLVALLAVIGGHLYYRQNAQALEKLGRETGGTVPNLQPEDWPEPEAGFPTPLEPRLPSLALVSTGRTGPFRVGNRTPYPIRLVILLRGGERMLNPETAHWDFAPGEGGSEGLLLSLGEEPLLISPGDVVVAFTLDGSRRYWGPNVVGESLAPFWHGDSSLWSMILQP